MNEREKSDSPIVPEKDPNKEGGGCPPTEGLEERGLGKGKTLQQNRDRTQDREARPNGLERIRQAAEKDRELRFTTLWHHVYDLENLEAAFQELKRNAAPGTDGMTWKAYEANLEENLQDLSGRLKRGAYKARPVKRVYIPKEDGKQRPIGITTLEDKLAQRATTRVLEAIYEVDFKGISYGFRPERGPHQALDALTVGLTRKKVNWVLDADIRGFFDAIDHECLIKFIEHRIADSRVIRHIKKWLKAGVLEDGVRVASEEGTPQGGSISPLLANIYLHYAFDLWVSNWRKKAQGDVIVVRFADDFVVGFQYKHEAERFQRELQARLRKFHLELHEGKTRLIEFGRFAASNRKNRGERKPETFTFLGFTFICGTSRRGRFQVVRKTMRKRRSRKLKALKQELRKRINDPIEQTGRWLRKVVQGHYQYYAVPLNFKEIAAFRSNVVRLWYRVLRRRSQKTRVTWEKMKRIARRWLPLPRIVHPYPDRRFAS